MLYLLSAFLCVMSTAVGFVIGMFFATRSVLRSLGITPPSFGAWVGWFSN